jgi:UDP-N-acetylglucosamine--N-acetylmuramyl-(pentapeptide) pyrophosphoryl-undecaprenol N-acetylglucosamine transferase
VGGSLGARTINESIIHNIDFLQENNLQLIWQTGKVFYGTALNACQATKDNGIFPYAFISRMDLAYAAADLIISRAGAIAISELCLVGKPVILVPSPNVTEDHQTKNAMALTKNNAAILVKDVQAQDSLVKTAVDLVNNKDQCELLGNNILKFAHRNAAEKIAEIIINMVN